MIELQHSAEPFPALHGVRGVQIRGRRPCNETIAEALVIAFEKIMLDIPRDHVPQVPLTESTRV